MVRTSRYGAIPVSPPLVYAVNGEEAGSSSPAAAFLWRARAPLARVARRLRPWREVLELEARVRARRNLADFRANYAVAAMALAVLGLLRRPVSMLAFLALAVAWLLLCFGRADERRRRSCSSRPPSSCSFSPAPGSAFSCHWPSPPPSPACKPRSG
ncbi:hypothetical protein ACP4OV_011656 [Aristida adscensionis]